MNAGKLLLLFFAISPVAFAFSANEIMDTTRPPEAGEPEFLVNKYSINLMWINRRSNPDQKFILNAKDADELVRKVIEPVCKWARTNPHAEVNLWYDSAHTSTNAINATRQILDAKLVEYGHFNAQLRDIREIPIVAANSDAFSDQTPVYFRIDLLKLIIVVDSIERGGNDASVFSDLEIGDLRTDGLRMGKEELFKPTVMKKLVAYGLVIASGGENQFIQLLRSSSVIEAIKHVLVNLHLARAEAALNFSDKSKRREIIHNLGELVYYSTQNQIHRYIHANKIKKPVRVKAHLFDPDRSEKEWIEYIPKTHGYLPWGLLEPLGLCVTNECPEGIGSFFKGQFKQTDSMLHIPDYHGCKFGDMVRDDLDSRGGKSHRDDHTQFTVGRSESPDGVYRVVFWD